MSLPMKSALCSKKLYALFILKLYLKKKKKAVGLWSGLPDNICRYADLWGQTIEATSYSSTRTTKNQIPIRSKLSSLMNKNS